jgi:protein phosphatase
LEFSAASDPGRVRTHNEDSFALVPFSSGVLLAVADGVSGSQAGEVASAIATRTFRECLEPHQRETPESGPLRDALQAANERILTARQESARQAGMGTTMTCAWLSEQRLAFAHVGDSRLYLLRRGELNCVTHDHSVAQELMRQGTIPPSEAERHPQKHVLTRWLGLEPFACDEGTLELEPGDVILLCTDGLVSALTEAEVAREMRDGFAGVALRLVEAANRAGGPDNITVVAARTAPSDERGEQQ